MPGLIGHCFPPSLQTRDRQIFDERVEAICHEPWYQKVQSESRQGQFACVHLGLFNHRLKAERAEVKVGIMIDGWLHEVPRAANGASETDEAELALQAYLNEGIAFVERLNGQFNLVIWDDRQNKVYLANDRYGLRPLQYAIVDNELFFGPEAKAVLIGNGLRPKINLDTVVGFLSFGRIFVGDSTFFESVEVLPPASIICFEQGKVARRSYWDYVYRPVKEIDCSFVSTLVKTFTRAVDRQTRFPLRYGISLSGGLDSRSLLKAATMSRSSQLRTYSWGMVEPNDENTLAQQVASRLHVPFHRMTLSPTGFIARANEGVTVTEGLDLCVQSYALEIFPALRHHTDVLLTGLALDVTLGGSYLSPELASGQLSDQEAQKHLVSRLSYFTFDDCEKLVRLQDVSARLDRLTGKIQTDWHAGSNDHTANQADRFMLRYRGRVLFMRQTLQRLFVEDIVPTFDNDFIDLILQIPPAERYGHRIYQRFLAELAPELMDVPYQRTLLPPSAPLRFWSAGAQIEAEKEKLLRAVWHASNGKIFIPYRRYCTNYDEWMRTDPNWIALVNDLLLSDDSRSCAMFLNQDWIRTLVADHRSGKTTHHHRILNLMTLELFLRQFFD
ncbi:MAG TPA: asparagine synthase-related protein [Candidatus Binatia bacterium]|jgi:asparagine synthase (glutamine-hydrolysing)|nr:asparagine synthase-related protein [Candidatus Binatia bacterium]